ncbi:MAG: glycoside hydrolase family 2 TIM barrel-domain containing protein [Clostridia bacterium]
MIYNINKENYKNFNTIEINKLPARCYFIPYKSFEDLKNTDVLAERYNSKIVTVLSGDWDFKYYAKVSEVENELDTEKTAFDVIKVPSCWQRIGYEPPFYLNSRYQFKRKPPFIPEDIPVGVYHKNIEIDNISKTYILSFLGVCSCLDLYVNGKFVGYSEGSHNSAEFDISPYLIKGKNEILAVVFKWCNGTYLECQDMFRENGIFRDVLLFEHGKTFINDYLVSTKYNDDGSYNLLVRADIKNGENTSINVKVFYKNQLFAEKSASESNVVFENLKVDEWSAEIPNIYEVFITLIKDKKEIEVVRNYTGFKHILINGTTFLFNNQKIKIKGVNHHDTTADKGYVMTAEEMQYDVKIMKEYNMNGVRTSHYPPDPLFLTLCDIYGLYVIDEADIETHGCYGSLPALPNLISDNPEWSKHFLDRVERMVMRDKNHTSITMWSLGNESGGFYNQDLCYEYIKKLVTNIPIHYEGVSRTSRSRYDVKSEMYTSPQRLDEILHKKAGKKYQEAPFFLCEYCHAMGVGPGSLEDYWQIMYASDVFMGGCIWEFADHAVLHKEGKYRYTYGGDHKEFIHDSNFCVDGLFYPDRTPHTGALNAKQVYRPIRATLRKDKKIEFKNTNSFISSSAYDINYELVKNKEIVKTGKLEIDIKPQEKKVFNMELENVIGDVYINLYYEKDEKEVAFEQLIVNKQEDERKLEKSNKMNVIKKGNEIIVSTVNFNVIFDKTKGLLKNIVKNGKSYLAEPIKPIIYRAPMDNDRNIRIYWDNIGYKTCKLIKTSCKIVEQKDNNVKVICKHLLTAKKLGLIMFSETSTYLINSNGQIYATAKLRKINPILSMLPCFGVDIPLVSGMKKLEYFGKGDQENLCDFDAHAKLGIYKTSVKAMFEPYIKPQDFGNHIDTKYVKFNDGESAINFIAGKKTFDFNVKNITTQNLTKAKHVEDIEWSDINYLTIKGFNRGTGTNSCGPLPLKQYDINMNKALKFDYFIILEDK